MAESGCPVGRGACGEFGKEVADTVDAGAWVCWGVAAEVGDALMVDAMDAISPNDPVKREVQGWMPASMTWEGRGSI